VSYLLGLVAGALVALLFVPPVRRFAFQVGAVDEVSKEKRKLHTKPIARAGGLAIFISFVSVSLALISRVNTPYIGLLVAGTIVLLVGLADDIWGVNPWVKLLGHTGAALVAAIGFGISIDAVSNPFGETFVFSTTQWTLALGSWSVTVNVVAVALTVVWLVGMTNTMNLLDGLDGLSSGGSGYRGGYYVLRSSRAER
jgi:UDP-GlcNAc:undecaprenyl-phosphate GlcNAc-1-phosphate transferase